MKKILNKIDTFFSISERGSNFSREIIGGIIVFFAMCYILPVNTAILSSPDMGMDPAAVFVATAICSAIATLFMGLIAKFPIALSAGMGMNAFIAFTVCGSLGYSWQEALSIIFVAGLLFLVVSLTSLRQKIINGIPKSLKYAISAGLGAFICFVGLKGAGVVQSSPATFVQMGDLSQPIVLLGLGGIILTFVLLAVKSKVSRLAIFIAMLVTALVGFILGQLGVKDMPAFSNETTNLGSLSSTFLVCFDNIGDILTKPATYAVIFSLTFVNLFDTTATLLAVGQAAGLMDDKGELKNGKKVILADASGSVICALLGTSPVTSFAESTVGIESGAKTGLSSTITGLLFFLSLFIYPVFTIFSKVTVGGIDYTPVTSLALVAVGAMMFSHLKHIEWEDRIIVFSCFLTVILMVLFYSISEGLGIGLIFYCLMMLASKRGKEVGIVIYLIAGFFIIDFVLGAIL